MREIRRQARWNPWLYDDHAEELASAEAVFSQWRRAEPGFPQLTWPEVEARMAAEDRRFDVERDDIRNFQHWHDLLAFGAHIPFPVQERSADAGSTWTAESTTTTLFDTKEYLSSVVLKTPGAVTESVRWT